MTNRVILLLGLLLLASVSVSAQALSIDDSLASPELKEAFKQFQPGPKLQAALDDLDSQGRDLLAQFAEGRIDQQTLNREHARRRLAAFVMKAWAFAQKKDEAPQIAVVILGSREFYQVFPRGIGHLPKQLIPKQVYLAAPGEKTQWQFVGQRDVAGNHFAIFRRVE